MAGVRSLAVSIRRSLNLGGNEEIEEGFLGESGDRCSLSRQNKVYGFAVCLLSGFACTFLSLIVFVKPIKFGILFTFGNFLAIISTVFLIGPCAQLRLMGDPVRIYATAIYFGSFFFALICAFMIRSKMLTLLSIVAEICALLWYSLSYVPFARRMVSNLVISCWDTEI
ncbi:uncharacterized protein LOC144700651 isoform X1 [Wolffia australiana]